MATVKIRFRASTVENKEGTLVYQVIHKRQTRQVSTGYRNGTCCIRLWIFLRNVRKVVVITWLHYRQS